MIFYHILSNLFTFKGATIGVTVIKQLVSPDSDDNVNTFWYAFMSILVMIVYRVVSALAIFKSLGWKSSLLQIFDLLLYREVYEAYMDERMKPTIHLRWIRRMEATFESAPQALLQMVFVLRDTSQKFTTLISLSVILSIYFVASSVIRGRKSHWNRKCLPHPKFIFRGLFRLFEISGRLGTIAVFWYCVGGFQTSILIFIIYILFFNI